MNAAEQKTSEEGNIMASVNIEAVVHGLDRLLNEMYNHLSGTASEPLLIDLLLVYPALMVQCNKNYKYGKARLMLRSMLDAHIAYFNSVEMTEKEPFDVGGYLFDVVVAKHMVPDGNLLNTLYRPLLDERIFDEWLECRRQALANSNAATEIKNTVKAAEDKVVKANLTA